MRLEELTEEQLHKIKDDWMRRSLQAKDIAEVHRLADMCISLLRERNALESEINTIEKELNRADSYRS